MCKEIPGSVQFVKGVGPKWASLFEKLNITTVKDLIYYFPRDYEDRSNIKDIKHIKPGETVTIKGKVIKKEKQKIRKNFSILRVTFSDDTDVVNGVWFNQLFLAGQFKKNKWYILSGEVNKKSWWKYNKKEINNPVFEEISNENNIHTGRVVPIYSLTGGMSQKRLRKVIYNVLNDYLFHFEDVLPDFIRDKYNLINFYDAIWGLHFPEDRKHYIKARKRMTFEELFILQLKILKLRKNSVQEEGIKHKYAGENIEAFLDRLSFDLTTAQQRVWQEIRNDIESSQPMQRLLQGDVGSGKTVIATLALIETMANNYQGVFMAPTEILAEQHYLKLRDLLEPLGYRVALIVGSLKESRRKELERKIAENEYDLVIGTHALFQETVDYNKIGLIVIDEQHRFGVEQRHNLKSKGNNPDLLVMTATPIPRTLALTFYGDLDLSVIDELPPGRRPVITTWRNKGVRAKIYNFIKDKLNEGRQVYIVCPLIEPSEELEAISALEMKERLENGYLAGYKIGILHSKLNQKQKTKVMQKFRKGMLDILVSTTVIEVGVDVPNATIMVIENAERFGLAQLHQLRGRVGRGKHQSYCILIGNPTTEEGKQRLKVITDTNDGFKIAEEDLEIRGPGEFFGTRQHGLPDLKVASLVDDKKILNRARREARQILDYSDWAREFPQLEAKVRDIELKV